MVERSPKFNAVKGYYESKRWTKRMVWNAVGRWITSDEAEEIISGE